jgi:hypothetical protein
MNAGNTGPRAQSYRLSEMHIGSPDVVCGKLVIACLIASEFKSAPTVPQLCQRFGMTRATAYRWRRAWIEAQEMRVARGEPA